MISDMHGNFALSILQRLIEEGQGNLSTGAAEAILHLSLADSDRARMNELASKSNQGTLTPAEAEQYDYIAVADLLSLWKSKARLVLKHHPSAGSFLAGSTDRIQIRGSGDVENAV